MKTARTLVLALVTALLGATTAAGPVSAYSVDDYARYQPQTTCVSEPLPGTAFLLRWLERRYPVTGYSYTLRSCTSGGTSEHKDGRAVDWAADAADPADRAKVAAFLEKIFATDKAGNRHALARRMGIMYLIWNDHIYSAYDQFARDDYKSSSCATVQDCSKTLRHRDHVHISLSRSGASAQTSFYRARNVPSVPVLIPGTMQLDPVDTALVRIEVPADGRAVTTDFKLTRGTTYRVVGDGRYRFGSGSQVADAACRWSDAGWTATTASLVVDGTSPWTTACDGRSTHVGSYTATRTDVVRLRITDDDVRDNEGSLVFYFLREDIAARSVAVVPEVSGDEPRPARKAGERARQLSSETATLRASAARGVRTERALRKGTRYKVVITGAAKSGTTRFDGSCVRYAGRLRAQHTLDLARPTADHLSVFVQGVRVELRAPATDRACDAGTHRYVGRLRAVVNGRARVKIWDPYTYTDNTGSLTVTLRRL